MAGPLCYWVRFSVCLLRLIRCRMRAAEILRLALLAQDDKLYVGYRTKSVSVFRASTQVDALFYAL